VPRRCAKLLLSSNSWSTISLLVCQGEDSVEDSGKLGTELIWPLQCASSATSGFPVGALVFMVCTVSSI